jgi:hypothetical protein
VSARRVLGVLECRGSDDAVVARAVAVASESGGYLTLVAVVPPVWVWNPGPYCVPRVTCEELRAQAVATLARAVALVPPDVPLLTAVEEGPASAAIARRVAVAAHDTVVARRNRLRSRTLARLPVLAVVA